MDKQKLLTRLEDQREIVGYDYTHAKKSGVIDIAEKYLLILNRIDRLTQLVRNRILHERLRAR